MAYPNLLETDTISGANITSGAVVGSYTASGAKIVGVQVLLTGLASGAATITVSVSVTGAGVGSFVRESKLATTDTTKLVTLALPTYLADTQVLVVTVSSTNASDTSVGGSVRFIDLSDAAVVDANATKLAGTTMSSDQSTGLLQVAQDYHDNGSVYADVTRFQGTSITNAQRDGILAMGDAYDADGYLAANVTHFLAVSVTSDQATGLLKVGEEYQTDGYLAANVTHWLGNTAQGTNGRVWAYNQDGDNIPSASSSGNTTPSPSGDDFLNLTEARTLVRDSGLQANEADYSNARVDRAIQSLGDLLCRMTKASRAEGTVPLNATSYTCAISSTLSGFSPERMVQAEAVHYMASSDQPGIPIRHADYKTVAEQIGRGTSAQIGEPSMIGFRTNGAEAWLDKAPGTIYPTLRVSYWQPFTTFTAGATAPDSVVLNVPGHILRPALIFGGPVMLQHVDPLQRFENPAWQKFEQIVTEARGNVGVDSGPIEYNTDNMV